MESEKMELRLINPNESGFLQHIEWNSEEIRKQVQMMMSAYTDGISRTTPNVTYDIRNPMCFPPARELVHTGFLAWKIRLRL